MTENSEHFNEMAELLEQSLPPKLPKNGETLQATIVMYSEQGLVVDIGMKMEGIIPKEEMRQINKPNELKEGDLIDVVVVDTKSQDSHFILSYDLLAKERFWEEIKEIQQTNQEITGKIVGQNRGGMIVNIKGFESFVPLSHLAINREDNPKEIIDNRMNQNSNFHIIEINETKQKIILSERRMWEKEKNKRKLEFIKNLKEKTIISGTVTGIKPFGIFVNIGLVTGLIPNSELSWNSTTSQYSKLKIGEKIDIYILNTSPKEQRVTLSIKRTYPDPWTEIDKKYKVGDTVEGTIIRLTDFGAFLNIEEGIDALIHKAEISHRDIKHPRESVYVGQKIKSIILSIESQKHRISLSYKQLFSTNDTNKKNFKNSEMFK